MNYTESDFDAADRLHKFGCVVFGALFILAALAYSIYYGSM